jgi:hypothetical protein
MFYVADILFHKSGMTEDNQTRMAYIAEVGEEIEGGYRTLSVCRGVAHIINFPDSDTSVAYLKELEGLKEQATKLFVEVCDQFGEPTSAVTEQRRLSLAWIQVCVGFRDKWTVAFVPPDVRRSWNNLESVLEVEETAFDETFDDMPVADLSEVAAHLGPEHFLDPATFIRVHIVM